MNQVFDVERALISGFKRIPDCFNEGSLVRRRVCFEGENNAGKSTFASRIAPDLIIALQEGSSQTRPVLYVEEPPRIWVEQFVGNNLERITYRAVAKEHEPIPNILTDVELQDPWVQANIFLASRRKLHEFTSSEFLLMEDFLHGSKYGDYVWGVVDPAGITSVEELIAVGGKDVLHIRGSASTKVFQGSHVEKGSQVSALIDEVYLRGYLAPEDLTLVVHPRKANNLGDRGRRTNLGAREETDAYEGKYDEKNGYGKLRGDYSFTKNLVHVVNSHPDRSYIEYPTLEELTTFDLTELSFYFLLLYLTVDSLSQGGRVETIPRGSEIEVCFNTQKFFEDSLIADKPKYSTLTELLEEIDVLKRGVNKAYGFLRSGDVEVVAATEEKVRYIIHK